MKTVLITGANGNLGVATVKKFLDSGYKVIAIDGKNNHLSFAENNSNFEFRSVDLTNEKDTDDFVQSVISKYGRVDGGLMLVGGFAMGDIANTPGADIQKQFALNFETAYFVTRPLLKHMKQNKSGRLVYIGARPAINPVQGKGLIAYGLTKSLLFRLAEFINEENKGTDIVATVVIPSTIDTPINRKEMPDTDPSIWVKPEQLAAVLEFINSDTGSVLRETVLKAYNNA